MAAKKGNKNAVGNSGGKPYSKDNREKSATLKGLVIDWAIKAMEGDDEQKKKEVSLKILPSCIPQVIQGDDESPLVVKVINYARDNNTLPIQPETIPVGVSTSTATFQNSGMEQEGWEVQNPTERPDKENTAG